MNEAYLEEEAMLTTTKLVDGVQVIQLATAELDPANGMRKVSERLHLDYILRELALRNPLPIMVDLTRLSDLTGWELADFVHVLSQLPTSQIRDRKSTRLNSSHQIISYAVFCLKKKK